MRIDWTPSPAEVASFLRSEAAAARSAGPLGMVALVREGYPSICGRAPKELEALAAKIEAEDRIPTHWPQMDSQP